MRRRETMHSPDLTVLYGVALLRAGRLPEIPRRLVSSRPLLQPRPDGSRLLAQALRLSPPAAADTRGRVSAESVRNWLRRSSTPSWRAGLVLVDAYGPEFLAAAMGRAPGWLDAAARAERLAALEARHAALAAEIHSLRSAA